ncbi:MAG TPA: branched-chain amino acid ABC transporter permease [Alphaproteobacteria bacterium]|jgi:branched-chain amino acid transport system permease protein|nr:branched-chain amino acid ABC transporter permease [Alphaproteobacteria bacterium]
MRFVFKTDYDQDIRLAKHGGYYVWYGLLLAALLAAPLALGPYFLSQVTFVLIYVLVGVGLMLLSGFTGQISLGHAAFFACGAYTEGVLLEHGLPFVVSFPAAGLLAAALGVLIGLPALRMTGIYLAIATLAFAFIVEEVLARWESVTHGNIGMLVGDIDFLGIDWSVAWHFYYLCLAIAILVMLAARNLLRSPTGRAFVAIRDSEIAAQSMGVNLAIYKTTAFAVSAGFTGLGGALYAHQLQFISPEAFTILVSIEFLLMVVVGGLGSLHGAVYGAIFVIALPQAISLLKGYLPAAIGQQNALDAAFFGIIIVGFMLLEPLGIYGRWMKVKTYFALFPLYKKAMFKRQKAYMKTEKLR